MPSKPLIRDRSAGFRQAMSVWSCACWPGAGKFSGGTPGAPHHRRSAPGTTVRESASTGSTGGRTWGPPRTARPDRRPCAGRRGRRSRPGKHHLWRSVRISVAQSTRTKTVLAVVAGVVALAVAATGIGYASMSKTVTLSIDGRTQEVHTLGDSVRAVLASQDIHLGAHDAVAPGLGSSVGEGQTIAVRYGRPFDVKVDGRSNRYWVTARDIDSA